MPRQYFSINREIFDIGFTSKSGAYDLQSRISSLVNGRLTSQMEDFLRSHIPEDFLYKFNTLTVDVGTVNIDNLEEELPEKFMEAFAAMLDEQIRRQKAGIGNDNFQILPTEHSLADLIDYFLYTGHLPWWAIQNELFSPSSVLDEMLMKNPSRLREIIVSAGQHEHVRRRLVRQFTKAQVRGIIQILEPGEATYIFGFEDQVTVLKKEESVVQAEEKEFERAVSYFILTYLLVERGGAFNRKEFARSVLTQIAYHFNMQYLDLLQVFYSVINTLEEKGQMYESSLKLLIRELTAEAHETPEWKKRISLVQQKKAAPEETIRDIDIIRQYLISGTLPFTDRLKNGEIESVRALLFNLITNVPQTFQLMLSQLSWNRKAADRLFELIGREGARHYLKVLYGSRVDTFVKIAATFSLLHKTKHTWTVSEEVFENAVWHTVVSATFLSPVSLIDDKQLIHFLLKGISTHLHVAAEVVAQRIQAGIKVLFNVDQMQMHHLDLISEVLTDVQHKKVYPLPASQAELNKHQEITDSLFSTEAQMLSHLLRFILQYKSLPWWGRAYSGQSPAMLFHQLYEKSLSEAQLVFQYAGASSQLRQRWLQSLGIESFLLILQSFDHSDLALKSFKQQQELLEAVAVTISSKSADTGKADIILADIIWQVLHKDRYRSFSVTDVYIKAFGASVQLLNVTPGLLLTEWHRWLNITDPAAEPFRTVTDALVHIYPGREYGKIKRHVADSALSDEPMITLLSAVKLVQGIQELPDDASLYSIVNKADGAMREKLAVFLLGVLKSYLLSGILPPLIAVSGSDEKNVFFRQLLQIVYLINPLELVKVLSTEGLNSYRVLEITSLYQVSEGGYAKDIALLTLPVYNKMKFVNRLQYPSAIRIDGKRAQEIFVEDITNAYAANVSSQPVSDRTVIVYEILQYYLSWNRLPESLMVTITVSADIMIRHLIRYLFAADQKLVEQLFSVQTNVISAIISIYTILGSGDTQEDKKIRKLISGYQPADQQIIPDAMVYENIQDGTDIPPLEIGKNQPDHTEIENAIRSGAIHNSLNQKREWVVYLSERGGSLYSETIIALDDSFYSDFRQDHTYFENLIAVSFTDTLLRDRIIILFRYFNLQSVVQGIMFRNAEAYYQQLLKYISQALPDSVNVLMQLYRQESAQKKTTHTSLLPVLAGQLNILTDLEQAADSFNRFYEDKDASVTSRDRKLEQQKIAESLEKELRAAAEKERIQEAEEARLKQKEKNVKLFIPNAGLVILHPFFATYFTRLGLMEANAFISIEAKERAVLLLQYIATGRDKFDEYELILNKILCGLPIEQPVAFEIETTEQERLLTEELFDVLKQRWDKVKNSTIDGIRASFIQREGALEQVEDQWNLRVEQRGYDMLLQTLPWAFGFIKTSWMNQILTVEWI